MILRFRQFVERLAGKRVDCLRVHRNVDNVSLTISPNTRRALHELYFSFLHLSNFRGLSSTAIDLLESGMDIKADGQATRYEE
jgi:hypothetical protein